MDKNPRPTHTVRHILLTLAALPFLLPFFYFIVPPPSTLMLARWFSLQPVERDWMPISQLSPHLIAAVVSAEDGAFCDHFGFDFKQMEKSMARAKSIGAARGASTISQQTAKNLFLWNGRSWVRKALEAPLTLWLELVWSKQRILEAYLNIAEWGDGIFGAEAAARHYFGVSAHDLSSRQAALLAAALPNPVRRSAASPGMGQLLYGLRIEQRMNSARPDLSCIGR